MATHVFAPGKIILSGEYAVVFGYPGIAVPAAIGMRAAFQPSKQKHVALDWEGAPEEWRAYAQKIVKLCEECGGTHGGTLSIVHQLPLGKGMGSSTALAIAIVRALLGADCRAQALAMEDAINPGHSGLDFAVIWEGKPLLFRKETDPQPIDLPADLLKDAMLIDTGTPNETTPELVAWAKEREQAWKPYLETIGECTQRLRQLVGLKPAEARQALPDILRDHHRAQTALGVVPGAAQELIAELERSGGAGKVLGAGAMTGGAGIVLALGKKEEILHIANNLQCSVVPTPQSHSQS